VVHGGGGAGGEGDAGLGNGGVPGGGGGDEIRGRAGLAKLAVEWLRAGCPGHGGTGILPGAFTYCELG